MRFACVRVEHLPTRIEASLQPELVNKLLVVLRAWDDYVLDVSPDVEASGVCPGACGSDWSVKEVMNHIAAWQEATLEALPVLLEGRKLPAGQYSIRKFNALHYAADQDRLLAASQRRLNRSRRELLAFLASAPAVSR